MEQKPLVTVLMGSCNPRWDKLRRAVESLRGQTLPHWELVLWDDGSDPQGALALEQAAALDSRVRLYRGRENRGLGYALNRCMERGRGSFLARLDDDDLCHPRRLERQVEFLRSHPAYGWVGCAARLVDRWGVWGVLAPPQEPGPRDFLAHSPYIHPGVMFRREVLEQAGGYSQSPRHLGCEDYHLFFRLHAGGERGYNLPVSLVDYWEDRDSYRRRDPARRLREASLRAWGFSALGLPPLPAAVGTLRPVAACLVPGAVLHWAKRRGGLRG
ncbi:MAG: glycosyltransferase [Acutalibacter sp.]|jgi:glycosyltransferase EpsE